MSSKGMTAMRLLGGGRGTYSGIVQAIRAAQKSDPDLFKEEGEPVEAHATSQVVAKKESEPPPPSVDVIDEELSEDRMPTPRVNHVFGVTDSDLASTNEWAAAPFDNTAPRPIVVLSGDDS